METVHRKPRNKLRKRQSSASDAEKNVNNLHVIYVSALTRFAVQQEGERKW